MGKDRFTVILEVITQYVEYVIPRYDFIHESIDEISESPTNLQTINIREIYNQNWIEAVEGTRIKKTVLVTGNGEQSFVRIKESRNTCNGGGNWYQQRQTIPAHHSTSSEQQDSPHKHKAIHSTHSMAVSTSNFDTVLKSSLIMKFPSPLVRDILKMI